MNLITIPQEFIKEKELVLIPRRELERLLKLVKKAIKEVSLTSSQKKALLSARKNRQSDHFLTLDELRTKLEITG